ncbi:MAG: DUF3488 domain-containing transglutaminase family protein [Deltaproteobacteria bacterium]|nr:DUF3488 domain-containing transglutaminase family protein [Deltaproteobacteria bacterium]
MEGITPLARRWLMTALSAVLLPHLLVLPGWLALFTLLVLGLGWGHSLAFLPRLPRLLKYLLFLLALLGFFVTFGFPAGRTSGSALLVLMAALKPLEIEERKSARQLLLVAYFLVAAYFYAQQGMAAVGWLFFAVFLVTVALTALEEVDGRFLSRRLLLPASILLSASLPLALVLFFLFPRLPGPLWSFPEERRMAVTGLPDELTMGSISRLVRSSRVALRAEFAGPLPSQAELYWRGPVFSQFDGRIWRRAQTTELVTRLALTPLTPLQSYTVTLEAHHQPWLLALDPPFAVPAGASFSAAGEVLLKRPLHQVYRYQMARAERFRWPATARPTAAGRFNQMAGLRNPRSCELARSWAAAGLSGELLLEEILNLFRQAPFRYTLDPPELSASAPVDDFLFRTRAGFCEHYAGAAAFLLQAAGLQARVVAGYLGGEIHPLGGYLVVRQYSAHAWVEVCLKNRGWLRVDPTAAVAPERVDVGLGAVFPENEGFFSWRENSDPGILQKFRQYQDLAAFYWNYWVLGYGPQLQNLLLGRLGLRQLKLWIAALIGLPLTALILGIALVRFVGCERLPAEVRLYRRYCQGWGRRGLPRQPGETPSAYARRLARAFPAEASGAAAVAALYLQLRYGRDQASASQLRHLRNLCRR